MSKDEAKGRIYLGHEFEYAGNVAHSMEEEGGVVGVYHCEGLMVSLSRDAFLKDACTVPMPCCLTIVSYPGEGGGRST